MPKTKINRVRVGVVTPETLQDGTIALARLLLATAASAQTAMAIRSKGLLGMGTDRTTKVRGPIKITEHDVRATDAAHLRHRAGTTRTGRIMEEAGAMAPTKRGKVGR